MQREELTQLTIVAKIGSVQAGSPGEEVICRAWRRKSGWLHNWFQMKVFKLCIKFWKYIGIQILK